MIGENISVRQAQLEGTTLLKHGNIDSYKIDARVLLMHALNQSLTWVICNPQAILSMNDRKRYQDVLRRRLNREPVDKICKTKEFWSLPFFVSKDVLSPRPESETLIALTLDLILDTKKNLRILDLGIGCGCLLLTLLKELPNATGIGIDISFNSLQVAQKNIENLAVQIKDISLQERVSLIQGHWGGAMNTQFDIIISNPPYICTEEIATLAEEVKLYDPLKALDGGLSGLDCYREIVKQIPDLLKPQGFAVIEAGDQQMDDIIKLCQDKGLELVKIAKDLQNIPRAVACRKH